MKKTSYKAFTLIEMLIVMGIIIILMVVGVSAARFAINRANDIAHQNAVTQIFQSLMAYYTDNRKYPDPQNPQTLIGTPGNTSAPLNKYMDEGSFKGGTPASYVYMVDDLRQSVLICVTLGGIDDETGRGIFCDGNAFGNPDLTTPTSGTNFTKKGNLDPTIDETAYNAILGYADGSSDWYGDATGWSQN